MPNDKQGKKTKGGCRGNIHELVCDDDDGDNDGERKRKFGSSRYAAADEGFIFARRARGCALEAGNGPNFRWEGAHAKFPPMSDLALLAPNAPASIWIAAKRRKTIKRGRRAESRTSCRG